MRSPVRYQDFAVRIEPDGHGGFQVFGSGGGRGVFRVPWGPDHLPDLLAGVEQSVRERDTGATAEGPGAAIGDALFEALLTDSMKGHYLFQLGRLGKRPGSGLRLRLVFDPTLPEIQPLCALPWELLYWKESRKFLSQDHLTPVVRHLEVPQPIDRTVEPLQGPLRILAVLSCPKGQTHLDVEKERNRLETAWRLHPGTKLELVEPPTLDCLRRRLREMEPHVLHFMGHGSFDEATGEGALWFEQEDGEGHLVAGRALAVKLLGIRDLRLVCLNACDTARLPRREGLAPYTGVASALVLGGIPAVVAMQFPISDLAAISFTDAFYGALAAGDPVDAAVAEGRQAIGCDSLEWATPVLFLGVPGLQIVTGDAETAPERSQILVTSSAELKPDLLPSPDPAGEPKRLQSFQQDLYKLLAELSIGSQADYERLNKEERAILSREILNRMTGIGAAPMELAGLSHVNGRFASKAVLEIPQVLASVEALHREAAIFSHHSLVCLPPVKIPRSFGPGTHSVVLDEGIVPLLLQHRRLIATGKMSVVPEVVIKEGDRPICLFNVRQLDTVKVDLSDPTLCAVFLRESKVFRREGALVFQAPQGGRLQLEDILEIEDRFRDEYEYFQSHLRKTLGAIRPDDETENLKRALREVDAGIRELDSHYESCRRRRQLEGLQALAGGALAVVLYSAGVGLTSFIAAAFAGSKLSSLVSFVPEVGHIPEKIRSSPFFVPWLIRHEGHLP